MEKVVVISEPDYKEIVCALRRLRYVVDSLAAGYMAGELDAQLERIEKVFEVDANYDQWFIEQLEARPTIIPAEEGE